MEKGNIKAVLTGDLVRSTEIQDNYKDVLNQIYADIKNNQSPDMLFEIFRGDSFQAMLSNPQEALLIAILIRAGLRRHSRGSGIDLNWDARISIGIGKVKIETQSDTQRLGMMDGEAFVRSGQVLDGMKADGLMTKITTGDTSLNDEFEAVCPLIDVVVNKWSTVQADAVYLHLLKNMTQKEIGYQLNKSQRAIGKNLETSEIQSLMPFIHRFNRVITWKFNQ